MFKDTCCRCGQNICRWENRDKQGLYNIQPGSNDKNVLKHPFHFLHKKTEVNLCVLPGL